MIEGSGTPPLTDLNYNTIKTDCINGYTVCFLSIKPSLFKFVFRLFLHIHYLFSHNDQYVNNIIPTYAFLIEDISHKASCIVETNKF